MLVACATAPPEPLPPPAPPPQALAPAVPVAAIRTDPTPQEQALGIRVEGLRLSAAGAMLDLRYRVVDAAKAAPLLDGRNRPYLLDEVRGARLGVPESPVLGRIRQTSRNGKILADRSYFIMFGNPGKALRSGDPVALLLGTQKILDLTVQ